ncbi:MAG TPA: iron ABC transporter permease [Mycobacteriales bacterium]|nr:iron ABC transporter permease [Mycobacteriales bacterium]
MSSVARGYAPPVPEDNRAGGRVPSRWSTRAAGGSRLPVLVALAAGLIAAASLTPVGYLVLREGFSLSLLRHELSSPSTLPLIRNTLVLVGTVCGFCVGLGVGLAVLVVRTNLPCRRMWIVLFTMPLAVPGFVSSYTWVAASFRFFPTSTAIDGLGGATLILGLGLFPYVFVPTVAALREVDATQEEVARSLGRSGWRVFWTVTAPQLRVAVAAGTLIIALHVFAEFGGLQLLRYQTLTTAIVQRITVLGAPESARALSVVLVGGSVLLLGAERLARGRRRRIRIGRGVTRTPVAWRLRWSMPIWVALAGGVCALALGVPGYVSVAGITDALHGTGVSAGVDWVALGDAAATSTKLAGLAALAATLAALPLSWLTARHPGPFSTATERAVWTAHSLPGVILALALVYLGVHWLRPLYQSSTMLVAAYVILFLPLAVGAQHVGLRAATRDYDDVAHSLGHGPLRTLGRVTLPLASPGIAAGALFVLLDVEKELTTTLLMRPTGTSTLATALWQTTNGESLDYTAAAPYGIALILIGVAPAYLLARRALRALR